MKLGDGIITVANGKQGVVKALPTGHPLVNIASGLTDFAIPHEVAQQEGLQQSTFRWRKEHDDFVERLHLSKCCEARILPRGDTGVTYTTHTTQDTGLRPTAEGQFLAALGPGLRFAPVPLDLRLTLNPRTGHFHGILLVQRANRVNELARQMPPK